MIQQCWSCKLRYELYDYNLATVAAHCPLCNARNRYDQSIERVYGKLAGEIARRTMEVVERMKERKDAEVNLDILARAHAAVEAAIIQYGEVV